MLKKEWRMKKLRLLLILSLIILCLFAFASCDDTEPLAAPEGLTVENTTLTLNWKTVEGARLYTISIEKHGGDSREAVASKNYYPLASLTEGTYTIKVKANGKEEVSRDSDWSDSITFVREHENGLVYTLINGNTEYEVSAKGAASGDIVVPDYYRGLPVTSIGKKAFFNKSDINSVTLGKNIRTIGDYAFANCSYITSINIPAAVTSIGENAFASCRLLKGPIVIPDGVTAILKNTFAYCVNLEEVVIGDGVKTIGPNAFTDCIKLRSVTFSSSLEEIGNEAFSSCESLTELNLPESLKTIGNEAFAALTSLTSVTIPNSVTKIGEAAFYRCGELATVNLGNGITEIGYEAFAETKLWNNSATNEVYVGNWILGCKDNTVKTLSIAEGTVGIASFAFFGNGTVNQVIIPNSVQIIGEAAFAQMGNLYSVVLGKGVREIGPQAFIACKQLVSVVLGSYNDKGGDEEGYIAESSLVRIGEYAFQSCTALESIFMPDCLQSIGAYAFKESGLHNNASGVVYAGNWVVGYNDKIGSDVTVKDSTVGIADYAFYSCKNLTAMTMTYSKVKHIGRAAFYDCSSLSIVRLPATLEVINDYTFYKCKSLKLSTFEFPAMLTYIGRSAFYKCDSASSAILDDTKYDTITLPGDVYYIGDYAFYGCGYSERAALEEEQYYNYYGTDVIVLGASVKYIGECAFYGFVSLQEIHLGGTEEIGAKAFYKCESLKTVDFGTSLKVIGEKAFYKCNALVSIDLPDSLTTLGNYAFYRCEALESVELGGTETVGNFAFYGDYMLKDIIFPSSVISIGRQAFRNCKKLTSVNLTSSIQTVEQHAFYGCDDLTLYVFFTERPAGWHKYWNSSYRPVVQGCVFDEENQCVLYVQKGTLANLNSSNSLSDPKREGYTFVGWGTSATVEVPSFTSANLSEAEAGQKLYAIWAEEQN